VGYKRLRVYKRIFKYCPKIEAISNELLMSRGDACDNGMKLALVIPTPDEL
jgi:hypothetical protein